MHVRDFHHSIELAPPRARLQKKVLRSFFPLKGDFLFLELSRFLLTAMDEGASSHQ